MTSTVQTTATPVLSCRDVEYVYGDGTVAFKDVSLDVRPGEMVVLTGVPESGKSTLLQLAGGLLEPTSGEIDRAGDVGWLVPCLNISVEDALGMCATVGRLRPLTDPPDLVLVEDVIGGLDRRDAVDAFHDTVYELADRGSGILAAATTRDTVKFADRQVSLSAGNVAPRSDRSQEYGAYYGRQLRPDTVVELGGWVERGALPIIDGDYGSYVVFPDLDWRLRSFVGSRNWDWYWFFVDGPTMQRLQRRIDRARERTDGPRTAGRHRLFDSDEGTDRAALRQFGGDACDLGDFSVWWPGRRGPGTDGSDAPGLERPWATHTSYRPPHHLALDDDTCIGLIEAANRRGPTDVPGARNEHRSQDYFDVTQDVRGNVRRRIQAAIESANVAWWGFDIHDYSYIGMRYVAGRRHAQHADLMATYSTRKLSVTCQLSDGGDYEGGDLVLYFPGLDPAVVRAPRTRGTIIVWPSWVPHEVAEITGGTRWSLTATAYGPPFR